jgi:replicative DNA helicase
MNGAAVEAITALAALERLRQEAAGLRFHQEPGIEETAAEVLDALRSPARDLVSTPLPAVTDLLDGGLRPSDMLVLAGRPGVGKSLFASQWARHAARQGTGVLLISREMSRQSVVERLLIQESGVAAGRVRRRALAASDFAALDVAAETLARWPLEIRTLTPTAEAIAAELRASQGRQPTRLLIVDHLQLLDAAPKPRDRRLEVEHVSRGLKLLALERRVSVLALSSVSRAGERTGVARAPVLSDLRESGAIEHDADIVIFLWRPDEEVPAQVECHVRKARYGRLGSVPLLCLAGRLVFSECSTRDEG